MLSLDTPLLRLHIPTVAIIVVFFWIVIPALAVIIDVVVPALAVIIIIVVENDLFINSHKRDAINEKERRIITNDK